jgi:UPF0716 protein FxsA
MARWLIVAFLLVPILELAVIIQVGQVIGFWPTLALLVAESIFGAWLVKREGQRAWHGVRTILSEGREPDVALTDAGLVLVGGTLLLTPGFITDIAGFACVLPMTRPLMRRGVSRLIRRSRDPARVRLVRARRIKPDA